MLTEGVLTGICRRKNKQKKHTWLAMAETGAKDSKGRKVSFVAKFREMLKLLGYKVPKEGFVEVPAGVGPWVFRPLVWDKAATGNSHNGYRVDRLRFHTTMVLIMPHV